MLGVDLVEVLVQCVVHPHVVPLEHQLALEPGARVIRSWVGSDPKYIASHIARNVAFCGKIGATALGLLRHSLPGFGSNLMIAHFVGRQDAEVAVRAVADVQDRQQILLSVALRLRPVLLRGTGASSLVLVAYPQTLDGAHVHCVGDSQATLMFVALNLQRRRTILLGLVQQDGPLDLVDDFLLVQKTLIELMLDKVLDFTRVDEAALLALEVV